MGYESRNADRRDNEPMSVLTIDSAKICNGRLIEGAYAEDESFTSVIIPEDVTDIGEVAFYGCGNLREVIFPAGLKYIREEAFGDTAVREAILSPGLVMIEEKAFFSCEDLKKIEIPDKGTVIGIDAFGCCYDLFEGYVACGYPENAKHHEELQYTLLWCSCPERHDEKTSSRAVSFIRSNEQLIMEWVIKRGNIPAMSGIARNRLLEGNIDAYIQQSNLAGRSEITALLMSMPRRNEEGEFDL